MRLSMKMSDSLAVESAAPSLFQIAAFFEDFFPAGERWKAAVARTSHLPFAEFMSNPAKLWAVLRAQRPDLPAAPPTPVKTPAAPKRGGRTGGKRFAGPVSNQVAEPAAAKPAANETPSRMLEFAFRAPGARSVKLAGSFTGWEEHSLDMKHSADGTWSVAVPLKPGAYTYRFIVDGQWCDDPGSSRKVPNPFGTKNSVVQVV